MFEFDGIQRDGQGRSQKKIWGSKIWILFIDFFLLLCLLGFYSSDAF